ncbi:MAG: hypothetical protein AABZ02_03920, partial [Bacteroidota bacterium]
MNKLTLWLILAALLMLVGCSKDDSTPVGPVANDQQQKVQTLPQDTLKEWENFDWTTAKTYVKSYPAPAKKSGLKKTATPPIIVNGGFEEAAPGTGSHFAGWTTFVSGFGIDNDFTKGWVVGATDPYTASYPPG